MWKMFHVFLFQYPAYTLNFYPNWKFVYLEKIFNFTSIFFRWVETTNQLMFIQENLCSTHLQIQHMKLQKRPNSCWFQPFSPIGGGCGWGDDRYWRCVVSRCFVLKLRCLESLQLRVCTCKVVLVGQSFPFGARPIFRGCFWFVSGSNW